MTEQTKAQRLADELDVGAEWIGFDVAHNPMLIGSAADLCVPDMRKAAAELRRLDALNAELVAALEEAVYEIEDWGAYASPYFQEKHDLEGSIAKVRAALAKAKEQT